MNNMYGYYFVILLNICLLISGQILWKMAISDVTSWNMATIWKVCTSPFFIGGGVLYVVATGVWIYAISKLPFSIAYPLQSMSYVVGLAAAYFLFKETVVPSQWFGVGLIILGAYFIAK